MMNDASHDAIRKAVIPIAGNGTRMFPETFFIKKVMLPVVDADGVAKPAILYMLEELRECGIEDIYLIVGEGEEEYYERVFRFGYDDGFAAKLPEKVRHYYDEIHEIGKMIHPVVQREKKGFGHAVYQAREYLDKEPCVLLLGDFLYKSSIDRSCTKQVIDAYFSSGKKATVGVKKIDVKYCMNYGIIHGSFRADDPCIMDADAMVEKPDEDYARSNLLVGGQCYATFGNYILTDDIFEYVGKQIEDKDRRGEKAETDLTAALSDAAENARMAGVEIKGRSYDVGLPDMYYETFTEFGKS